jgi:hypothetical protein
MVFTKSFFCTFVKKLGVRLDRLCMRFKGTMIHDKKNKKKCFCKDGGRLDILRKLGL